MGDLIRTTDSRRIAELAQAAIVKLTEDNEKRVANSAVAELAELAESPGKHPLGMDKRLSELVAQFRERPSKTSDLGALDIMVEATHKRNSGGAPDEILQTLLEATMHLTDADRGFMFLRDHKGDLRLAAARERNGDTITDDNPAVRKVVHDAATTDSEFLLTELDETGDPKGRGGLMQRNLRSVICFPIGRGELGTNEDIGVENSGVLYLDDEFGKGRFSSLGQDLLRAIAKCAAAAVENAVPVQIPNQPTRYSLELDIAHDTQQGLSKFHLPELSYAKVDYVIENSEYICGDVLDVILGPRGLTLIVADVSGRGVRAALIATLLRGILYSQIVQDFPLTGALKSANSFLCERSSAGLYATILVASLLPNGELEFVNCGHVPPLLISGESITEIEGGTFPVGLVPETEFTSQRLQLQAGDRLLIVTDGVTEAMDPNEELFGFDRLKAYCRAGVHAIKEGIHEFRRNAPLSDDITMVELTYCRQPQVGPVAGADVKMADSADGDPTDV